MKSKKATPAHLSNLLSSRMRLDKVLAFGVFVLFIAILVSGTQNPKMEDNIKNEVRALKYQFFTSGMLLLRYSYLNIHTLLISIST